MENKILLLLYDTRFQLSISNIYHLRILYQLIRFNANINNDYLSYIESFHVTTIAHRPLFFKCARTYILAVDLPTSPPGSEDPLRHKKIKHLQDILKILEEESIVSGFTSSSYRLPGSRIMKQS